MLFLLAFSILWYSPKLEIYIKITEGPFPNPPFFLSWPARFSPARQPNPTPRVTSPPRLPRVPTPSLPLTCGPEALFFVSEPDSDSCVACPGLFKASTSPSKPNSYTRLLSPRLRARSRRRCDGFVPKVLESLSSFSLVSATIGEPMSTLSTSFASPHRVLPVARTIFAREAP